MKKGDRARIPYILYSVLAENTDQDHLLSMPGIIAALETDYGISPDSRTILSYIHAMQDEGIDIRFVNHKTTQGYYLCRTMSLDQAFVLNDAVSRIRFLSEEDRNVLKTVIGSSLSVHERGFLDQISLTPQQEEGTRTLASIHILLSAVRSQKKISFYYFDYTVTKQKKYRRKKERYQGDPYAVVSGNGKYYCVIYAENHHGFANYRLDKMEDLRILDREYERKPFRIDDHMRASFNMYHGTAETVTLKCRTDTAGILFDEFGKNIIISEVSDSWFTASIRTAVTPTLTGWLLQFCDRITVLKPESLICEIRKTGEYIMSTYAGGLKNDR